MIGGGLAKKGNKGPSKQETGVAHPLYRWATQELVSSSGIFRVAVKKLNPSTTLIDIPRAAGIVLMDPILSPLQLISGIGSPAFVDVVFDHSILTALSRYVGHVFLRY